MIDPAVHAALVVVFTWVVNWVFVALGLDLGNETATGLAQVIVAYILSLLGLSLVRKAKGGPSLIGADKEYKPPFT